MPDNVHKPNRRNLRSISSCYNGDIFQVKFENIERMSAHRRKKSVKIPFMTDEVLTKVWEDSCLPKNPNHCKAPLCRSSALQCSLLLYLPLNMAGAWLVSSCRPGISTNHSAGLSDQVCPANQRSASVDISKMTASRVRWEWPGQKSSSLIFLKSRWQS